MTRRFTNLPLFWKLLLPFATLLLIVGSVGTFLIVRNLTSRAQADLEAELQRASLDARGALLARELYLLESANLAANLEGMPAAVRAGDAAETDRLLQTVLALKGDLHLLTAVTGVDTPLVTYVDGAPSTLPAGTLDRGFVTTALDDATASRQAGVLPGPDAAILGIAAPICDVQDGCVPAGAAIVGLAFDRLAAEVADGVIGATRDGGVSLYGPDGALLASAGLTTGAATDVVLAPGEVVRRTEQLGDTDLQTLYAAFAVQGQTSGLVAVTLPAEATLGAARDAALGLVSVLIVALLGIVGVGAAVSRLVTQQVRPLLDTNRALGAGDLSARAPEVSEDEIGQLARGLNLMAEELQASHATLESRVEQRTAEVRRLLEQRTEVFASLSHELRTPLAIILSEVDLLEDVADPHAQETATAIRQSAAALLSSVNDILDLARAESGNLPVDLESLDLAAFVNGLRPTVQALARAAELTVDLSVPPMAPVRADPARLREVVLNLVDNAVKYTPSGGRVDLRAASMDGQVVITVADTGVGIPEDVGDKLFEPFYRVPGNRPHRGARSSGLGLALTRQLVRAQQGTLTYTSRQGAGTTFTLCLPQANARLAGAAAGRGVPPPPPPGA